MLFRMFWVIYINTSTGFDGVLVDDDALGNCLKDADGIAIGALFDLTSESEDFKEFEGSMNLRLT